MKPDPPYRTDLINAAMGAGRLSNATVARKAGVGVMTVSKIRNGNTQVGYVTLKKVVEAIGLSMAEIATPKTQNRLASSIRNQDLNVSAEVRRGRLPQ
jgi:transcriptional regulator with XRE-family HTH domain